MKKVFYLWICFLLVFNVCLPVYADENAVADISEYYNPDYEEYVKSLQGVSEEEFEKKLLLAPSEYSYNEDYVSDTNMYATRSSYSSTYDSIKDMSFDLKDIDSYPSSGIIGWSFAASDALEIYLRKKCSVDKDDCDFSAIRLMSQTSSTKVPDTYAMSDIEFYEGSFAMAAAYWLRNEHSLENENIKVMDTVSLSDLSRWSGEEQSEKRINSIKRMIMDYGGVYTKYELFTDAFDQYYSSYNNNNGGEIISGRTIDSGVVIIGWDDNYAIDRFGESKPSKPGAFKVLTNRVVESNVGTIHLGTYYISYDMVNFLSDISAVKKAFVGSYAKNTYEYDKKDHSGIAHSNTTTNVYANKYVNSTGNAEKIKSITTYCEVPNSYFNVYISKDGSMANLEKVNIEGASNIGYNVSNMGYVTMELSDELIIDSDFTVAIEVRTPMTSAKSIPQERMPVNIASISGRCFVANNISDMKNGNYSDCGSRNNIIKVHTDIADRSWNFNDTKFDVISNVKTETKIDGLTFMPDVILSRDTFDESDNVIKGEHFKNYVQLGKSTDYKKRSLSFDLNGPSDIYVAAKSNAPVEDRRLALFVEDTGKIEYKVIKEKNGYHIKYRGEAGRAYLYSADNNIRIYAVAVNDYVPNKYDDLKAERVWNFSDTTQHGVITENRNIDGLKIYANAEKSVGIFSHGVATEEGYQFYNALYLQGSGSNNYRSASFDVAHNSYIYIAAKVPTNETRKLIVTNRYCCDLESDMEGSYIDVNESVRVYRIKYTGIGEEVFIRSDDQQIRIYQIAVTKMSDRVRDDTFFSFENETVGSKITTFTADDFYVSSTHTPATIVSDPGNGYTKAISLPINNFKKAGKIYFPVTDSRGTNNNNLSHKIKIVAKGNRTRLYIGNKYGYVYTYFDLDDTVKEYTYDYNCGAEWLYLFANTDMGGGLKIYSVETSDINYDHATGGNALNVSSKLGEEYKFHFTGESIPALDIYYYNIYYNPLYFQIEDISFGPDIKENADESIVEYIPGRASFVLDDCKETNWSGIVATVTFKAIANGNSYVSFSTDRRYDYHG